MKRLLLLLLLIPVFTVSALAVDEEIPIADETPDITIEDTYPSAESYTVYDLDEYSAHSDDEDFHDMARVITSLLGEYTPRTQTVTEHLSDGTTSTYQEIVPGVAGMDFVWLAGALLFALVLFCIFKIIGGLLKL